MEKPKKQKNHWTETNINDATVKINKDIYKRNRQAPIQLKMDDLAILINDKITRRGIAKGMVCIQEDLNKNIFHFDERYFLMDKLTFDELYEAYILCLKNKKRKVGTYNFVNDNLCENLMNLLDELNNRQYVPKASNCYVITDPALREIYAAQFGDRIVQHFYMNEIGDILEKELVEGCCSCRIGKGNDYALSLLKKYLVETSENGKKDCFFLKIDLSRIFYVNRS